MPVLLLCSVLGYCLFLSRFHNRFFDAASPAVACSLVVVILDVGGILGILKPTAFVLFAFGLLLLLFVLAERIKKRDFSLRSLMLLAVFIAGAAVIHLTYCRNGSTLYRYDNFTHWGLISRFLIRMDRFPTVEDTDIISFTSYPVGSACFIYYVCKVLGNGSTAAMLEGQVLLVFSYYFALMGSVQRLEEDEAFTGRFTALFQKEPHLTNALKWEKIVRACGFPLLELVITGVMIACLCRNYTGINDLLVDNLLAAGGLAAILICANDAERIEKRAAETGVILGAVLTIKNSGAFFSLFLLVFILMALWDTHEKEIEQQWRHHVAQGFTHEFSRKKVLTVMAALLLIPVVLYVLWKVHGTQFKVSKHTMSLSLYLNNMLNIKTAERQGINSIIIPRMLSLKNNRATLLTAFVVLLSLLGYLLKADSAKMFRYAVFTVFVFFFYECGTLIMYHLSMGYKEVSASNGSEYFRYNSTIVAVIGGILVNLAVTLRNEIQIHTPVKKELTGLVIVCTAALLCYQAIKPGLFTFVTKEAVARQYPDWALFETISNDYAFSAEDTVLVLYTRDYHVPKNGSNYFLLPCTDYVNVYSASEMKKQLSEKNFDYVIDLEKRTVSQDGNVKTYP